MEGTIQKSIDEETKSNDEINAESKQLKPNSEDDTRQQKSQIQIQSETVSKLNNQSRNIDISKESRSGLIDSKASSVDKDTVDHVESGSISQVNVTQECSKSETNVQGINSNKNIQFNFIFFQNYNISYFLI